MRLLQERPGLWETRNISYAAPLPLSEQAHCPPQSGASPQAACGRSSGGISSLRCVCCSHLSCGEGGTSPHFLDGVELDARAGAWRGR